MKTKFTVVTAECGDWQALYMNGKLFAEGHSLSIWDVFACIADILPNEVRSMEIPDEVAEDGMPMLLEDLQEV
jgi:hypothetical protein